MADEASRAFTDLEAWKQGHQLVLKIDALTGAFPREEIYGLVSQMRRASISVTSNIVEGFGRRSLMEKLQFYNISRGSLIEVQNQLLISRDIGFLSGSDFEVVTTQCTIVHKLLNALMARSRDSAKTAPSLPPSIFHLPPSRTGFTLPELIIVMGVVAVLALVGIPAGQDFLLRRNVDLGVRGAMHALRRAQIRSVVADGGSPHGVRFTAGTGTAYVVFEGASFAARDAGKDETDSLGPNVGVSFSFPDATSTLDVVFSRVRGKPAATGTIVLTAEGYAPQTISVGAEGSVQVE